MNLRRLERLVEKLWQSAHDYEYQFISGAAIGLLTIGVIQNKPKCLLVSQWQSRIWNEYYSRKVKIMNGEIVSFDFSEFGNIPHTVPELKEEVFG